MSTETIRQKLFTVASEFKTVDEDEIAEIDANIEIALLEVDTEGLGDNLELGTAFYTAWVLKDKAVQDSGNTGLITMEKIGDEEIRYANNTRTITTNSENEIYYSNTYGKRYLALLKGKARPKIATAVKNICFEDPFLESHFN